METLLERRAIETLKVGILPPDKKNIIVFKKIAKDYALVTCFAFACGIAAAFPLAKMSSEIGIEQTHRAPIVYKELSRIRHR